MLKEFEKWKKDIEKGKAGILFVEKTEEHISRLKMDLEMEYDINFEDSEMFCRDEEEIEKEPRGEYTVTIIYIEDKLGRIAKLECDKELAMEFENYQKKLIKERKGGRNSSHT